MAHSRAHAITQPGLELPSDSSTGTSISSTSCWSTTTKKEETQVKLSIAVGVRVVVGWGVVARVVAQELGPVEASGVGELSAWSFSPLKICPLYSDYMTPLGHIIFNKSAGPELLRAGSKRCATPC